MKKIVVRLLLAVLSVILVGFLGFRVMFLMYKGFLKVVAPQKILIDVDFIYSDTVRNEVLRFADSYLATKKMQPFYPNDFSLCLNKRFKIVKMVEWNFVEPGVAKLKIVGTKPFYKINDSFVLGDNQNIFDFTLFDGSDSKNLKHIKVAVNIFDPNISFQLYSFLQKVSDKSFFEYDWNYLKDSSITLFPKKNKEKKNKILFVTDSDTFFENEKFALAEKALDLFEQTIGTRKFGKKNCLVDTRFKNRLVVKPINNKTFNFLEKGVFKMEKTQSGQTKNEGGG